jgi:tetratricopeptide (TPR) repeat protein
MPPPPRRGPGQGDGDRRRKPQGQPRQPGGAGSGRSDRPTRAGRPGHGDRQSQPGRGRPSAPASRGAGAPRDDHGGAPRRPRVQEPALPADVSARDLDRNARAGLRSLPESLAEKVACHLVAAGRFLDEDPARAREHAWYARSLAPRLAIVREAAGVAAYAAGDYAAALAELRAVRRMTGDASALPIMADCERGLGRPERALALARDPEARTLDAAGKIELGIVVSGARRDRGEYDAAVVALQGPALDSDTLQPWTPRLWYAYAAALEDAGRKDEALRWFESVAAIDEAGETDAVERAAALSEN